MIQNVAKAAILQNDSILLQKCMDGDGIVYYELPGGRQRQYETMEDTVIRKCLEETGYTVAIDRFLALQEEIVMNFFLRESDPDHAHRIFHIYQCHILGTERIEPHEETDAFQVAIEWVPLANLSQLTVRPLIMQKQLASLLASGAIGYMPANRITSFFRA